MQSETSPAALGRRNPLRRANDKLEGWGPHCEWLVFVLCLGCVVFVTCFHEPWFDEAQAWLIARDASLQDILFSLPHYEGHPPLWHLILLPFARAGISYEVGIKLVSILLSGTAFWLILFKSPFPRAVRFVLPFTYFLFYQYTIISRNYSLMLLAFVVVAMCHRTRNRRPFGYVLALMLLCASSAYGLAFSAGIALVWVGELWRKRWLRKKMGEDALPGGGRRLAALGLLLAWGVALGLLILPSPDAYALGLGQENSLLLRLLYMVVLAPLDALCFQSAHAYGLLSQMTFVPLALIAGGCIFLLVAPVLYWVGRGYGKLPLLLLPYGCFALVSASTYFYSHHIGVIALFLLFWLWTCLGDDERPFQEPPFLKKRVAEKKMPWLKGIALIVLAACLGISVFWTASASAQELSQPYGVGREISEFIVDNGLEDTKIMIGWGWEYAEGGGYVEIVGQQDSPTTNAYFDHNVFYNGYDLENNATYLTHQRYSEEYTRTVLSTWRENGPPDVLLGDCDLSVVFGSAYSVEDDYALVKRFSSGFVWKDNYFSAGTSLRIRRDLLKQFPQFQKIEG